MRQVLITSNLARHRWVAAAVAGAAEQRQGDERTEHQHYIDKYEKIKNRDGEDIVINNIKTEVKRMMYDKRGIVGKRIN